MDATEEILLRQFERVRQAEKNEQGLRKAEEANKRSNTPLTPEEVKMRLLLVAAAAEEKKPTSELQSSRPLSAQAPIPVSSRKDDAGSEGVVESASDSLEMKTTIDTVSKDPSEFKPPMRRPRQRTSEDGAVHIPKRAVIKKRAVEEPEPEEGEVYEYSHSASESAKHDHTPSTTRNDYNSMMQSQMREAATRAISQGDREPSERSGERGRGRGRGMVVYNSLF